jgi:protein gp37
MSASRIEWTDRSDWNPIRGCTRVSEGCGSDRGGGCYAEAIAARFSDPGMAFHGFARRTPKGGRWTGKVALIEDRLLLPLRWKKPARVFASSTSDVFHEALSDADIDRIFAVMALCPQLTFQVLTKRSARMREYLSRPAVAVRAGLEAGVLATDAFQRNPRSTIGQGVKVELSDINPGRLLNWTLPNVWLGVSVEDQGAANLRVPDLLQTPAAVRFLSCEPLLGPVDLTNIEFPNARGGLEDWDALDLHPVEGEAPTGCTAVIDWVIAGGESGPRARPMHPAWARSLRDQCRKAGVPFFFKQWGEYAPGEIAGDYLDPDKPAKGMSLFDGRWDECWSEPDGHCDDEPDVYRVGKKRAGRLLDGVEHSGFPDA